MLKSANLLHKCGLGDSDMSSTVILRPHSSSSAFANQIYALAQQGNIHIADAF